MRVLITGGFGLLGGRIAQQLVGAGHAVVLGSRRAMAVPEWAPTATVAVTDWSDASSLERACLGIDAVVHTAGMNAQDSSADPAAALEANGVATARLVAAARRQGVSTFLYMSTAHVYGAPLVGPLDETSCPTNLHPYASSHRAGEDAVLHGYASDGRALVLRISNSIGVPTHADVPCWTLLVPDLCRQAAESRQLVLHSSGVQQRDFIPTSDVCALVQHLVVDTAWTGVHRMNVGAGVSRTILEMAELVQERCRVILGFLPPLTRRPATASEERRALALDVGRYHAVGCPRSGDVEPEIDALLKFCAQSSGTAGART